jgi:hypothetical protein
MDKNFKLQHGLTQTFPVTQIVGWKFVFHMICTKNSFIIGIYGHTLQFFEMLPVHPVPVMNTYGIAFRSSMHDPEDLLPMIPASSQPIWLLSTRKSCMSTPSLIGPILFLPSINLIVPLPKANELIKH